MKKVILVAVALSLGGCATVTRGTTNKISFESEPAGAAVQTSDGHMCPSTPCIVEIPRKSEFVATFSKPGYEEKSVSVMTKLAGEGAAGFAGNVLVGGIVGMGVDAATGSTLEHYPNPVRAELRSLPATKRTKSNRQRSSSENAPTT